VESNVYSSSKPPSLNSALKTSKFNITSSTSYKIKLESAQDSTAFLNLGSPTINPTSGAQSAVFSSINQAPNIETSKAGITAGTTAFNFASNAEKQTSSNNNKNSGFETLISAPVNSTTKSQTGASSDTAQSGANSQPAGQTSTQIKSSRKQFK